MTNEELQAENARLKDEVEQLRNLAIKLDGYVDLVRHENERLRKAGDAMAEEIIGCYLGEGYDPADSETLPKWNAAKEGKQP